jgi:hypothetical protein
MTTWPPRRRQLHGGVDGPGAWRGVDDHVGHPPVITARLAGVLCLTSTTWSAPMLCAVEPEAVVRPVTMIVCARGACDDRRRS